MPTGTLNNLPSAIALMVLTAVLFTLRRRNRHLYLDTWVAAIFIAFLGQLLWFFPAYHPEWHRPIHIASLVANALIGFSFAIFDGKLNRPSVRRTGVFASAAIPVIALAIIYGMEITDPTFYYGCAILGLFCAGISLFLKSRTYVIIQFVTWLLVAVFAWQHNLRAAAYFATGAIYLYAAINTWRRLSRSLGRLALVASLTIWAASYFIHPWIIAHPIYATFATKIWEMQKFFAIVAMLLILLEYESNENQRLALHDQLTGLANRRLMEKQFLAAVNAGSCELVLIDLNSFKTINDTLGHLAGDELLVEVSNYLRTFLTSRDTIARVGGDEFVIISTRSRGLLAPLITTAFPMTTSLPHPGDFARASVGSATYPEDCPALSGVDATKALLSIADTRMYAQKRIASNTSRA